MLQLFEALLVAKRKTKKLIKNPKENNLNEYLLIEKNIRRQNTVRKSMILKYIEIKYIAS